MLHLELIPSTELLLKPLPCLLERSRVGLARRAQLGLQLRRPHAPPLELAVSAVEFLPSLSLSPSRDAIIFQRPSRLAS